MGQQTCFSMQVTLNDTIHLPPVIRQGMTDTINRINSIDDYTTIAAVHFDQFDHIHYCLTEIRQYTLNFILATVNLDPNLPIITQAGFIQRHRTMCDFAVFLKEIADGTETIKHELEKLFVLHGDIPANSRYRDIITQDLADLEFPHRMFISKLRELENILIEHNIDVLRPQWWEEGYDE